MSLAYVLHDTITVTEKEDVRGISIVKFKTMVFSEKNIKSNDVVQRARSNLDNVL